MYNQRRLSPFKLTLRIMDLNSFSSNSKLDNIQSGYNHKDQNNAIGNFLQNLQQKKKQDLDREVVQTCANAAGGDEESGVTAINKYNPYEQDEDEDDEVFDTINRIPIPVLPLDLDYKPKNVDYSYSFNEAYKIQNAAMNNELLLSKMKAQLPDIGFFRLNANSANKRHNGDNHKSMSQKKKERTRNSSGNKAKLPKKNGSGDKTDASLEEKVEMMRLEQEINTTGNKMQDFELFKQMMKSGNTAESSNIGNYNPDSSKTKLSGIFALSDLENDNFQDLGENNTSFNYESRETQTIKNGDAETRKGSKYASFLKESMGLSATPDDDHPTQQNDSSNSSKSKLMGFFNQQKEQNTLLPQNTQQSNIQPLQGNGGRFPFKPIAQQQMPNNFNPMIPPPQFYQQQQGINHQNNTHQNPPTPFNPSMNPPPFFQQHHPNPSQNSLPQQNPPNNFNPMMGQPFQMMGMPPQFMMMTPQQQQQFFIHQQQQQMKNNSSQR